MQQQSSYRRFSAWTLILIFTAMWLLKTGHGLLLHHAEASNHPVCEAAHDQKSAHIHDERWAAKDCLLCAFVVAAQEPFLLPELPEFCCKLPNEAPPVCYLAPFFSNKACDSAMRRGPPMA